MKETTELLTQCQDSILKTIYRLLRFQSFQGCGRI